MGPTRSFVPLGEIMTPAIDPHRVDPEAAYPNIGIYSFGRGIFRKAPIVGSTSSASTLYRVRAGQFIYSRLFAFEGAYGIVPAEADGAFVSNEFPTFDIDQRRADPDYLGWLFRVPAVWRALAEKSVGMGDRRKRVKPETVLAHRIALPPIQEQLRLAAQIDRMAVLVDEAGAFFSRPATRHCEFAGLCCTVAAERSHRWSRLAS
jgi:type I restriction enzyme S subunit